MAGGTTGRQEPLPRLLIVIDEFALMVRDLPDFVTGLVNIAMKIIFVRQDHENM